MPRILEGGPGLGVSPNHAALAVASAGRLMLIETTTQRESASVELPSRGESDVVMLSHERALVLVRLESATVLLGYSLPRLELVASMELPGKLRPLAMVAERVLVAGEAGDAPRTVSLGQKSFAVDPIALREPVQLGAAAPEERLLVSSRDQLECWDPLVRRALFRINLPVTRPRLAGFSSRKRLLWVVSGLGQLEVFRYSDGRLQARTEMGRRIVAVDGHPESPRLVVATKSDDGPVELTEFDLAVGERYEIASPPRVPASFCIVDGAKPTLVVASEDGGVEWVALPRATPLEEPPEPGKPKRPAEPAFTSGSPTGPQALAEKLASWRSRMAEGERVEKKAPVVAPKPVIASKSTTPSSPPLPRSMERERERERERAAPPARVTDEEPLSWRDRLLQWAEVAHSTPSRVGAPPVEEESTLETAVWRLGLGPGAVRTLAALYAQWLLGDGQKGLPASTVAALVGTEGEPAADGPGWVEALGRGQLARTGAVRVHNGRVWIHPAAARFLDGRGARLRIVSPPPESKPAAERPTSSAVISLDPADLARAAESLAAQLGRAVALLPLEEDQPERRRIESGLVEARLHDALLLISDPRDATSWVDLLDGQVALVAVPGAPPEVLAALPQLQIGE